MSGKVEEDKDVSKQGMNFIQQGKKAHEEWRTMYGITAESTSAMIHYFNKT